MRKRRIQWLSAARGIAVLVTISILTFWIRSYSIADGLYFVSYSSTQDHYWRQLIGSYQGTVTSILHTRWTEPESLHQYLAKFRGFSWRTEHFDPRNREDVLLFLVYPKFYGLLNARYSSEPQTQDADAGEVIHGGFTRIELPHWASALLFGVMPFIVTHRQIQKLQSTQRAAEGLCVHCGYDLRASGDRCPECGTNVVEDKGPPLNLI